MRLLLVALALALAPPTVARPAGAELRLLAPDGVFERDFSYAVVPQPAPSPLEISETDEVLTARTAAVELRISKAPCRLEFRDARTGAVIHRDAQGPERYYGLGEKTKGLEKGGSAYTMWNTDHFAYDWRSDPLYQSVPF